MDDPGDDHHGQFLIATKEFWMKNRCLDDSHISGRVKMPSGFNEVEKSIFDFDGHPEDGRRLLLRAGFEENIEMLP